MKIIPSVELSTFQTKCDDSLGCKSVLSTCPLHNNTGCGKKRRILLGLWWPAKAALLRNYLEIYWPCAGGLLAVNAIGTQLRDPTTSLERRRLQITDSVGRWLSVQYARMGFHICIVGY